MALWSAHDSVCSNHFQLVSEPAAPMAPEDEEYLAKNLFNGSLPLGEVWFDAVEPGPGGSLSDGQKSKETVASDSETCFRLFQSTSGGIALSAC